ncbi:saccharopine dehydrogenase [Pseudoxanthomonas broegbernensis]|uniref:Saccharopine dehydrogenase n=1 Tax=Pseudoxanthomonas broegbernensis TaxID=83619 RepID=A0A7V8GQ15_9GAMM|nr:saccharopine dehydrogenase NADP-binding domain-containing protein [Pseudoxanthomonas broegbernensis]KAF1688020.1 saccharopine dehydrogenase [Pseudoxanthomonas broegbernensis]MBB6065041.1 saccharopine dehydrogenase-like NADP-dependent oxidoreductase [Pseudoxanthomonas broegbernensis]
MKTLVLGGYGNFGARICRALAGDANIDLLVAGRNAGRAQRFADTLDGPASAVPIDCNAPDFSRTLAALGVDLVIHTAGPFQEQSYAVARAAARAGTHYIDLADGRRFVCDFPSALQDAFQQAGRVAISGASTVPALSSAVVDHLSAGWRALHAIDICIAPAQTAPRGKATLAAVLSYCGKPICVWRGGQWTQSPGWATPERVEFKRLRPRIGALCDIPDLELFPARYGVRDRVMFRAALEVAATQCAFAVLAALRGMGLLKRPERLAGLLDRISGVFDTLGTPLGGMVVHVEGLDHAGCPVRRAWHIAADNDDGPEIPCMATILLARKLAAGKTVATGAFTAAGLLSLDEFEPEFARWGMATDVVDEILEVSQRALSASATAALR